MRWMLIMETESPLYLLHVQRGLLHCTIPPLLLLASPLPIAPTTLAFESTTRQSSCTKAFIAIHKPVVCGSYGVCTVRLQQPQISDKSNN